MSMNKLLDLALSQFYVECVYRISGLFYCKQGTKNVLVVL